MSYPSSRTASKRVPKKYHLTLFTQSRYRDLPVYISPNGLVEDYLDRLHRTIETATKKHSKIFACRLDLHFPQYFCCPDQGVFSNEYIHAFIKRFRCRLRQYGEEKQRLGRRLHDLRFNYFWVREYGPTSGKPHFHLLLLFNGHAFNTLGCFSPCHEGLFSMLSECWAEALGLHPSDGAHFAHAPNDGQYRFRFDDYEQLSNLFHRASYLAKVDTKNFYDGCYVCGFSRA